MDNQANKHTTTDSALSITLRELPMEVSDYAFDQLPERLSESNTVQAVCGESHLAYESQRAVFSTSAIGEALQSACRERLVGMKREVRAGERDDYTVEELENYRKTLPDIFAMK